jgi:hypothetical protein
VLVASDGEWPEDRGPTARVTRTREQRAARFHGLQIGNRGRTGLHAMCIEVYVFDEWAGLLGPRPR